MKKLSAILGVAIFLSACASAQVNQGSGAGAIQNPNANGGSVSVTSNQGVGANNSSAIVPVPEVAYQTSGGNTTFACQEDHSKGLWDVRCPRSGVTWASNPSQALINTIQAAMCYHLTTSGSALPMVQLPQGNASVGGNIGVPPGLDLEGFGSTEYGTLTNLTTTDPTQPMFTMLGSMNFTCNGTPFTASTGTVTMGNMTLTGGGAANAADTGIMNFTGGNADSYIHNISLVSFGGPGRDIHAGSTGQGARGDHILFASDLQWYYYGGAYNTSGFTDTNPHCSLNLADLDSSWSYVLGFGQLQDSGYYNRYYLANVCLGGGGQAESFSHSFIQIAPHNIWMVGSSNGGQHVFDNRFDDGWWDSLHVAGSPGTFVDNQFLGYCTSPTLNPTNFPSNPGGVTTDANCSAIEVFGPGLGSIIRDNSIGAGGLWSQWPIWAIWTSQNVTGAPSTIIEQPGGGTSIGGQVGGDSGAGNVGSDISRSFLGISTGNHSNVGGTIHFKNALHTYLNDTAPTNYTTFDGLKGDLFVTITFFGANDTITPGSGIFTCTNAPITSGIHWFYFNGFSGTLQELCPSGSNSADNEVPAGTIDGTNVTFTLANAPNPASALHLYRNGLRLVSPTDYTITGNTITYANPPSPGDTHVADYSF